MSNRSFSDLSAAYSGGALRVRMPAPRIDLEPDSPSVSVVIPAMNEAKNLPWLAERMPRGVAELILVDGRSHDDTVEVARALWPGIRVITQNRKGKGNALACGFVAARSEIVVMIDADGSMDPGEIPYFVAALRAGADYAKGSRFTEGGGSSDITHFRAMGNRGLNRLTKAVHGTGFTDLCYGYNAFWARIVPVLALDPGSIDDDSEEQRWGDGFEVETLINIRVHLAGLAITEVPSFETPRLSGASNLNAFSDGIRVLKTIGRENRALRRGARLRGRAVESMLRQRSLVGITDEEKAVLAVLPAGEIESRHDLERGVVPPAAAMVDLNEEGRISGVSPLTGRDFEVIDLAAAERLAKGA